MLLHKKMLQRSQCNAGDMSRPRILLHDLVMKHGLPRVVCPVQASNDKPGEVVWSVHDTRYVHGMNCGGAGTLFGAKSI